MPESRDRLVRPVDLARRRTPSTGILIDDPEVGRNPAAPGRRGGFGTPRNVRGRNLYGSAAAQRSSGRGSVLPSWYPRTPLQDITAVVRVNFYSLLFNFHVVLIYLD